MLVWSWVGHFHKIRYAWHDMTCFAIKEKAPLCTWVSRGGMAGNSRSIGLTSPCINLNMKLSDWAACIIMLGVDILHWHFNLPSNIFISVTIIKLEESVTTGYMRSYGVQYSNSNSKTLYISWNTTHYLIVNQSINLWQMRRNSLSKMPCHVK